MCRGRSDFGEEEFNDKNENELGRECDGGGKEGGSGQKKIDGAQVGFSLDFD
jgi:hypothetical protein